MLKIRKQSETLSGSEAAVAATRASSPRVAGGGGTFARGAGNWGEAASLPGRLETGQLIAPEVSLASPGQQAALM